MVLSLIRALWNRSYIFLEGETLLSPHCVHHENILFENHYTHYCRMLIAFLLSVVRCTSAGSSKRILSLQPEPIFIYVIIIVTGCYCWPVLTCNLSVRGSGTLKEQRCPSRETESWVLPVWGVLKGKTKESKIPSWVWFIWSFFLLQNSTLHVRSYFYWLSVTES